MGPGQEAGGGKDAREHGQDVYLAAIGLTAPVPGGVSYRSSFRLDGHTRAVSAAVALHPVEQEIGRMGGNMDFDVIPRLLAFAGTGRSPVRGYAKTRETVRLKDRADAQALRERFGLADEDGR